MSRLPAILLFCSILICIAGIAFENISLLLMPIAVAGLVTAYVMQRKLSAVKKHIDLDAMSTTQAEWVSIVNSGDALALSDQWDIKKGKVIMGVPRELAVTVSYLEDDNFKIIKSVNLSGRTNNLSDGEESMIVDTGFLYIGDANLFDCGISARDLERYTEEGYDRVNDRSPLMVAISDSRQTVRAIILGTGLGDGVYKAAWCQTGGIWSLNIDFL